MYDTANPQTCGAGFLYYLANNHRAVGFVLDDRNPSPLHLEEFQGFKTHPAIQPLFESGKRLNFWEGTDI